MSRSGTSIGEKERSRIRLGNLTVRQVLAGPLPANKFMGRLFKGRGGRLQQRNNTARIRIVANDLIGGQHKVAIA